MEELEFTRGMQLYDKVPIEECWRNTGKDPIFAKWIDINQGDDKAPKCRSRNVAREIAYNKKEGLTMTNNQNAQVVALELWRFCAHCVAAIVVVGAVLIGFLGSWELGLKVGVLPLPTSMPSTGLAAP